MDNQYWTSLLFFRYKGPVEASVEKVLISANAEEVRQNFKLQLLLVVLLYSHI